MKQIRSLGRGGRRGAAALGPHIPKVERALLSVRLAIPALQREPYFSGRGFARLMGPITSACRRTRSISMVLIRIRLWEARRAELAPTRA